MGSNKTKTTSTEATESTRGKWLQNYHCSYYQPLGLLFSLPSLWYKLERNNPVKSPCPAAGNDWKMILNQTLCSPVQKEKTRGKKRKRNTKLQQMKKMVEALQERKGAVTSHTHTHTHKLGRQGRLTQSPNTQRDTLSACIIHHTHIKRGSYHDINGAWLESISQKTSDTNGNHISDLVLLQKEGKGRAAWWNTFSAENKQEIFHLYYFLQREGEGSLPTMRKDGNKKCAVPQERPWPSKHSEPQVSEYFHDRWQRAALQRVQAGKKDTLRHTYTSVFLFCTNTHIHTYIQSNNIRK